MSKMGKTIQAAMVQLLDGSLTMQRLHIIKNSNIFPTYVETLLEKSQESGDAGTSVFQIKGQIRQALFDRQNEVNALAGKCFLLKTFYNKCQTVPGDIGNVLISIGLLLCFELVLPVLYANGLAGETNNFCLLGG